MDNRAFQESNGATTNYGGPDGPRDPIERDENDVGSIATEATTDSESEPEGFDDCDCVEIESRKLGTCP